MRLTVSLVLGDCQRTAELITRGYRALGIGYISKILNCSWNHYNHNLGLEFGSLVSCSGLLNFINKTQGCSPNPSACLQLRVGNVLKRRRRNRNRESN